MMRTTVWIVLEVWSGDEPAGEVDGVYSTQERAEGRAEVLRARHEGIRELSVYVVGKFVTE